MFRSLLFMFVVHNTKFQHQLVCYLCLFFIVDNGIFCISGLPRFLTGQHFLGQKRAKNYTLCYHEKSPAKVLTTDETIRVELQQQIAQGICLKVILVLKRVCTYRFQTVSIFKVF